MKSEGVSRSGLCRVNSYIIAKSYAKTAFFPSRTKKIGKNSKKHFYLMSLIPEFLYLCSCYLPVGLGRSMRRVELLGGALHIERRYWRFVFGYSNFHNRLENKNNAEVTPRSVYIRLRSVLRGLCNLNAHFTVYLYTPAWVFTLSVFLYGCGRPEYRTDGS